MSCYVDPLFVMEGRNARVKRVGERHGHRWCHLWADTLEELHAMAQKIGMRREWFQPSPGLRLTGQNARRLPHYDLVPPRREEAVKLGAIEMDLADWYRGKRPAAAEQQTFDLAGMVPLSAAADPGFVLPSCEQKAGK